MLPTGLWITAELVDMNRATRAPVSEIILRGGSSAPARSGRGRRGCGPHRRRGRPTERLSCRWNALLYTSVSGRIDPGKCQQRAFSVKLRPKTVDVRWRVLHRAT